MKTNYTVKTQIIDSNGKVIRTKETNSSRKMSANEKSDIYKAELSSGKSIATGEALTSGQINYRTGYCEGLLKKQYYDGFNAAKKDSSKKTKKVFRRKKRSSKKRRSK